MPVNNSTTLNVSGAPLELGALIDATSSRTRLYLRTAFVRGQLRRALRSRAVIAKLSNGWSSFWSSRLGDARGALVLSCEKNDNVSGYINVS